MLYERCRPREWMLWAAPYDRLPAFTGEFKISYSDYSNIPACDYALHWQLEGPRAPEEVK